MHSCTHSFIHTYMHSIVVVDVCCMYVGGQYGLYHAVPSRIAINMIMSCAAGGTVAVAISCWAQLRYGTDSLNANEIANGILSCLVAITAACPFVTYYAACAIGSELCRINIFLSQAYSYMIS